MTQGGLLYLVAVFIDFVYRTMQHTFNCCYGLYSAHSKSKDPK